MCLYNFGTLFGQYNSMFIPCDLTVSWYPLQWIPGHCQIAGNEHAVVLAKKGAKITQTHIRTLKFNGKYRAQFDF